jgi:hypothetical protein
VDIVRATHDVVTEKGTIRAGDVLLVDSRLGGWKIIGGNFDGYFLQDREISFVPEYVQLKQELLQLREEVRKLTRERDELRDQLEQRLPELPREVSDAIEELRNEGNPGQYILWRSSRESAKEAGGAWDVLYRFVNQNNSLVLANALQFGYTVKKSTIREEIDAIIADCDGDRRKLTDRLTDLFETRLEQKKAGDASWPGGRNLRTDTRESQTRYWSRPPASGSMARSSASC